jgi:predicted O-methyltransferase YrrM
MLQRLGPRLRKARRLRALPDELSFDEALAVARSEIGITQQTDEARWLFDRVRALRPRVVVEIGVAYGGTLFLWTRAASADAVLVGLDARPVGRLGNLSPFPILCRTFATRRQRIELLMGVDSHDQATVGRLEDVLGGRSIDFLFVDGDHSYDGVREDTALYGPLVREDGLIAFHDVSPRAAPQTEGTARFWREFASTRSVEAEIVDAEPGFGIGLYRVPSGERWRLQ